MASMSRSRCAQQRCRRHVRVPGVGTPAIRHQIAPDPLTQEFLDPLGTARQPDDKDGSARGGGRLQPGPLPAFTPARLVQIRGRLRLARGPCLGDWVSHGLDRRLLQVRDCAEADDDAKRSSSTIWVVAPGEMIDA